MSGVNTSGVRLLGAPGKAVTVTENTALDEAVAMSSKAPKASPTLTGTPLAPTAADNTSTTQIATTAFAKAADAVEVNPKAFAQGIYLTAGTSGGGIAVADSVHLDQGTGAFTLSCKRNLASYVVAAILMEKHDDTTGYRLSTVVTTGYLKLEINDTTYTSSAAPVITAGTEHEFTVTASPGATNTTVTFYCDGVIVGTAQTDTNETTTDNAVSFYAMGTDAIRTAGIDKGDLVYNRAMTAAQVLSLYRNGIDFSDKWGSQTEVSTGAWLNTFATSWATFASAGPDAFTASDAGGVAGA